MSRSHKNINNHKKKKKCKQGFCHRGAGDTSSSQELPALSAQVLASAKLCFQYRYNATVFAPSPVLHQLQIGECAERQTSRVSGLIYHDEARDVVGGPCSLGQPWYDEIFQIFLRSSSCIIYLFFNIRKLNTFKAIDWRFFHDFQC